jgi:hypothetical protein
MKRWLTTVVVLLVAVPVISFDRPREEVLPATQVKGLLLGRDLEMIGLTANAASLIREGRTERALMLLERRMSSALSQVDQSLDEGIRLPASHSTSLTQTPRRARDYATKNHLGELASQAAAVSHKLGD